MEEDLKRRKIEALNDKRKLAKVSNDLATYYYEHERYSDALCEYQQQLKIYVDLGSQIKWATCHRMIGEMYLLMEEFDKAIKFVKQHLSVVKELKNRPEELMALETLGRIYLVQGESFTNKEKSINSFKAAEKMFVKGLTKCEIYQIKDEKLYLLDIEVRILLEIGEVQEHLRFYDKGIDFLRKAIVICLNEELYDVLHKCYIRIARLHSQKKDFASALDYSNRALELSSSFDDKDLKTCTALTLQAEILCKMSDYEGAKRFFQKAWNLNTSDVRTRKYIESKIKVVLAMCNTEELARSCDLSDHVTYKKLYEKLGDGACRLKNYDGAVGYYLQMLDHAVRAGDSGKKLAPIYFSLYQTYKDMGCYNEAIVYGEKEYELWKAIKPKYAIFSLNNIAETLFLAKKPYHQVEKACIAARNVAKKINKKKYEITSLNRLLCYQEKYGETDKMNATKIELQALAQDSSDNMESSEDEQSSDGEQVRYEDTMGVEDSAPLEDLPGSSESKDGKVAEKTIETKEIHTIVNPQKQTALHRACQFGRKNEVESLLANGHPVNIRNDRGYLPLHYACNLGRLEIVNTLINSGADVNASSYCTGSTPLHEAAGRGNLDLVHLLLENGAISSVKDKWNTTPLDNLQIWRTLQFRLSKQKETFYKEICNKLENSIQNTSDEVSDDVNVNENVSNSENFQDNDNAAESVLNPSTELNDSLIQNTSDTGFNTSKPKTHVKPIKDRSLPSTSKTITKIPKSHINYDQTFFATDDTESPEGPQSSNHKTEISGIKEYRNAQSTSIHRNSSKTSINNAIPVGRTPYEEESVRNKQNDKKNQLGNPLTVVVKAPPSDIHKKSVENMKKVTDPEVVKSSRSTKPDVSVNVTSSNSNNLQNIKKVDSELIAAESMLNTNRQLNNSESRTAGEVDIDILKSKTPLKNVKDKKIQDLLIFDDSLDSGEFPAIDVRNSKLALSAPNAVVHDLGVNKQNKTERKSSPMTVGNKIENMSKITEPLVDSRKRTKPQKFRDSVVLNENSSNSDNFQDSGNNSSEYMLNTSRALNDSVIKYTSGLNTTEPVKDISLPKTSEICHYFQESQGNENRTIFPPDDTQSLGYDETKIVAEEAFRSAILNSKNRGTCKISKGAINKSVPALTTSSVANDKNSIKNTNKITDTLVKCKTNTKRKKSQDVSYDVNVNKNRSNSENFQHNINVYPEKIAAESVLNTNMEVNDNFTKDDVVFNTLKSKIRVKSIKELSQPSTSKLSSNIQKEQQIPLPTYETEYLDTRTLNQESEIFGVKAASSETKKSIPALLTPSGMGNGGFDHDSVINKQNETNKSDKVKNRKRKLSDHRNVLAKKLTIDNRKNIIECINNINKPQVKSKKNTNQKKSRNSSDVGGNKNSYNSVYSTQTNFQDSDIVRSKSIIAESMVYTSKECSGNSNENTDSIDLSSATNPILKTILPSFLEISDYIQEFQSSENQTAFSPEDTDSPSKHGVYNETKISKNARSASKNTNVCKFSEDYPNKSIPTLFTTNDVGNDEFRDDDRGINIQKKDKKKVNRKLGEPSNVEANNILSDSHRNSLQNINELIEPLVQSKESAEDRQLRVSDFVGVNENNIVAGNENLYPKTIAVKSLVNYTDGDLSANDSKDGFNAADNLNSNTYELMSVIQPVNLDQTSNMKTQIISPATVAVHIEEELELISLNLDTINMLTISWLVEEVKCRYYNLKGTCPEFNLMTSEGAILFEDEPLNLVLSSPELYTCLTKIKASPTEERYQESCNELGIHDANTQNTTDDNKSFLLVDKSIQPTLLCPKQEKSDYDDTPQFSSTQPESPHLEMSLPTLSRFEHNESPQTTSSRPKYDESLQSVLHAKSPRPGSLAQPASPGCGFAGPALLSESMQRRGTPTNPQDPVIPSQPACLDELELDKDILQLLHVVPVTETLLGPPVHKVVAKNWQEILAKGLQKDMTDEITKAYSVPANCDLLLAPKLNPEVKATIHEDKANLDSSLMEQQKKLGLAISALGTAVNTILLNETSKQMILKPISDACRILCDIHFRETETRRHNVIASTNPELQELLLNTVRTDKLFGDNVNIKSATCIIKSEETSNNGPNPAFDDNIFSNEPSTSKGN